MSNYQYLRHVVKIQDYSSEVQKLDLKLNKIKRNKKKIDALQEEKEKILAKIDQEREKYYANIS